MVVASAVESKYASTFINTKEGVYIREILETIGYIQNEISIYTDNSFVHSISNETIKIKRSKAMDMRYHWLRDRMQRKQFKII